MRPSLISLLAILPCAAAIVPACGSAHTTGASSAGGGGATSTSSTTTVGVVTVGTGGMGGTGGSIGVGGDGGQVSDVYPAPHPAPPQVITVGGPVLTAPHVVPIFFSDDDPNVVSGMGDFLGKVGATQYWAACTTEYGVGALTADPAVMLSQTAPTTIDDSAIQTWLSGMLDADDSALPPPDDEAIYAIFYPASTTVTMGGGTPEETSSCVGFEGYHDNITLDPAHGVMSVAYVVVPTCDGIGGFTGVDGLTAATSHELIEACTDPFPSTMPAYSQPDQKHLFWAPYGGEVGDMCETNPASFTKFSELPYAVQRTWSNAAALAGQEPCVPPLPGESYANAAPEMSDTVEYYYYGEFIGVQGVKVAVGQTRIVDIDLYSPAATPGPWSVSVEEMGTHNLVLQTGDSTGQNGQKVHLAITAQAAGQATFTVVSFPTWGGPPSTWLGFVNQ